MTDESNVTAPQSSLIAGVSPRPHLLHSSPGVFDLHPVDLLLGPRGSCITFPDQLTAHREVRRELAQVWSCRGGGGDHSPSKQQCRNPQSGGVQGSDANLRQSAKAFMVRSLAKTEERSEVPRRF